MGGGRIAPKPFPFFPWTPGGSDLLKNVLKIKFSQKSSIWDPLLVSQSLSSRDIAVWKVVSNVPNIHLGIYKNYQNLHTLHWFFTRLRGVGADLPHPPPQVKKGWYNNWPKINCQKVANKILYAWAQYDTASQTKVEKGKFQSERVKILLCFWQFFFFLGSEMPGIHFSIQGLIC